MAVGFDWRLITDDPFEFSKAGLNDPERMKAELVKWIAGQEWHEFVTLSTNYGNTGLEIAFRALRCRTKSRDILKDKINQVFNAANRALLGSGWQKKDPKKWVQVAGMIEKLDTNPHAHLFCRLPPPFKRDLFRRAVQRRWRKLAEGGSMHFREVREVRTAAKYVMKDLGLQNASTPIRTVSFENLVLLPWFEAPSDR